MGVWSLIAVLVILNSRWAISIYAVLEADVPLKLGFKRMWHMRTKHPFDNSTLIEKLRCEAHPDNTKQLVYTVNVRQCNDCGLIFHDKGFEYREGDDDLLMSRIKAARSL